MGDYVGIRAAFYNPSSRFPPSEIDCTLLTHLIYVPYIKFSGRILRLDDDDLISSFSSVVRVKNKLLTTLLLLPPYSSWGYHLRPVISVDASIALVRELKFDGVILNVEHKIAKADKFLQLCEEWRREVEAEARRTGRRCLLFTACFHEWPLPPLTLSTKPIFHACLDWVCLRAHQHCNGTWIRHRDSHGGSDFKYYYSLYDHHRYKAEADHSLTLSHTLYTAVYNYDHDTFKYHGTDYHVRACIDSGIHPSKIVLGLAIDGFSFDQLHDPSNHGMHLHVFQPLVATTHKQLESVRSVFRILPDSGIKRVSKHIKARHVHDATTSTIKSVYIHASRQWIGRDDTLTISNKVNYLKRMKLAGYALNCGQQDTSDWKVCRTASREQASPSADLEKEGTRKEKKGSWEKDCRHSKPQKQAFYNRGLTPKRNQQGRKTSIGPNIIRTSYPS